MNRENIILAFTFIIIISWAISWRKKSKPDVKTDTGCIVISTPLNASSRQCKVFDEGNGPYIVGPTGNVFYLIDDGNVTGMQGVNADPYKWNSHIGTIKFKEKT